MLRRSFAGKRRKLKAAKKYNLIAAMTNDNSRLKRFGSLFLNPRSVLAVGPIYYDDDQHVRGLRVVLTGGTIDVIDPESVALIVRQLEDQTTLESVSAPPLTTG